MHHSIEVDKFQVMLTLFLVARTCIQLRVQRGLNVRVLATFNFALGHKKPYTSTKSIDSNAKPKNA